MQTETDIVQMPPDRETVWFLLIWIIKCEVSTALDFISDFSLSCHATLKTMENHA